MTNTLQTALSHKLLALADDELILGHRNSEWTGHAPILEEDIAIANIAQDEMGHAGIWYNLYSNLTGKDPDQLVFFRDAAAYRNAQLVELPKGDWAFTLMRQFLFDAAEVVWLESMLNSQYQPLAQAAAKIRQEEIYHYRHSSAWIKRLALGTTESRSRCQSALNTLWPYTFQLFTSLDDEALLVAANHVVAPEQNQKAWEKAVVPFLQDVNLEMPASSPITSPRHKHTHHLTDLLAEMQEVARAHPEASW